jgi:phosphoribosyl 1,2-cyclic phosphodiesterase
MKFCIIASGSEGNCTLVEDSNGQSILVDAGLSMRRIAGAMAALGRDLSKVNALLISHEHADHLRGAAVLSRRLDVPIFTSAGTASLIKRSFSVTTRLFPLNGEIKTFGNLEIQAFHVSHDAAETLGFMVREGDNCLAIATDLGTVDLPTLARLQECNAIILEANHDLNMLITGSYPWDLKRRIQSNHGHLSNDQAAEALLKIAGPSLKLVVLAHLSQENNRPHLALETVRSALDQAGHTHITVLVASQYEPTNLLEIN